MLSQLTVEFVPLGLVQLASAVLVTTNGLARMADEAMMRVATCFTSKPFVNGCGSPPAGAATNAQLYASARGVDIARSKGSLRKNQPATTVIV